MIRRRRSRLNSKQREELWDRVCAEQEREHPLCNLCHLEIQPGQDWDESHVGKPAWMGGTDTGVAHRRCNRVHGALVVTPMFAKSNRQRRKYIGAFITRTPLPGGRDDRLKRKLSGEVVPRDTGERP
jgi:hypothetical protein